MRGHRAENAAQDRGHPQKTPHHAERVGRSAEQLRGDEERFGLDAAREVLECAPLGIERYCADERVRSELRRVLR